MPPRASSDLHGNAPDSSPAALLIIDAINDLEFDGAARMLTRAIRMARCIARLKAKAATLRIPTIYVNDNFGRWRSDFHRIVAHCRTYDVALELVRAGFGVCLAPALTAHQVAGSLDGIELYATDHGNRRTVAIIADQYLRLAPYKGLVEALQAAGRSLEMPPVLPMPKVLAQAAASEAAETV